MFERLVQIGAGQHAHNLALIDDHRRIAVEGPELLGSFFDGGLIEFQGLHMVGHVGLDQVLVRRLKAQVGEQLQQEIGRAHV